MTEQVFDVPDSEIASFCDGTDRIVIAVAKNVTGVETGDTVALVACAADTPTRSEGFPLLIGAGLREGRFVVLLLTLQSAPRETVRLTSPRLDPWVPSDFERLDSIIAQAGLNVFFYDRDTSKRLGHTWIDLDSQGVAYFDAFTQFALQTR
jgi:hypothetical protein